MNERRRGLGRGLGALIPSAAQATASAAPAPTLATVGDGRGVAAAKVVGLGAGDIPPLLVPAPAGAAEQLGAVAQPATVAGAYFAEIPAGAISPNPRQPREYFDEDQLAELVASIKEVGLLQPIVVRRLPDAPADASGALLADGSPAAADGGPAGERYELVMGERRWRACCEAELERIPAIVRATDDEKLLLDALLENLHRAQLNPIEEAAAYDQLLRDFSCTHEELADRIGRSRSQVSNTLRLMNLSPKQKRRVASGVLSAGHARALLGLEPGAEQDALADRVVQEQLSVREVEEIVRMRIEEGAPSRRSRRPRAGRRLAPELDELSSRLSDRFETRVKVDLGQKKGKIVVEFASMDDLDRILGALAPGEGRVLAGQIAEGEAESQS